MGVFAQTYSFLNPITRFNCGLSLMDDIAFGKKFTMKLGVRYDYFLTKDKADEGEQNMGYIRYLLQNMQGAAMNFDPIHDKESGFSFLTSVSYAFHPLLNISLSVLYRLSSSEHRREVFPIL